jgi:hypothetical protein
MECKSPLLEPTIYNNHENNELDELDELDVIDEPFYLVSEISEPLIRDLTYKDIVYFNQDDIENQEHNNVGESNYTNLNLLFNEKYPLIENDETQFIPYSILTVFEDYIYDNDMNKKDYLINQLGIFDIALTSLVTMNMTHRYKVDKNIDMRTIGIKEIHVIDDNYYNKLDLDYSENVVFHKKCMFLIPIRRRKRKIGTKSARNSIQISNEVVDNEDDLNNNEPCYKKICLDTSYTKD